MSKSSRQRLSRRDFLKLSAAALGGAALACGRGQRLLEQATAPGGAVPAGASPAPVVPAGASADMILVNGRILTVDASNSVVEALAIQGDKILATGRDRDIYPLARPGATVIDLKGRTATPGFVDPHIHFRVWGLQNTYYTPFLPPEVRDIPSLQRALADVLKRKQPGEWIMGYYFGLTDKQIFTKEDLDPVSRDNPVFIMHIGGHWGTANSVAMQVAGVTNSTPSPQGGIIEKKNGELTGVFYNHRAMDVVRIYVPPIGAEQMRQSILSTQTAMAACGVTCFHDNNIRMVEDIQAYQQLAQEGLLFLRNELYLTLEWPSDMDKVGQVQPMDNAVSHFAGYKFLIDGQGPTAYCHQPHNGVEYRLPTWDPQMFKDTVRNLHDTGLQICVHCIGDAATDLTLDAYEAAMNANARPDPRHRIEHAILTTPQATRRMKDLGVVVSTQPAFIYLFAEGWMTLFTPAQMTRAMVTREWVDAGVHVAIGSDAPSTPLYNPPATLAGSMTRITHNKTPIGADQVFDFEQALRAHTIEGAYAAHKENVLGSLEAGKYADLVVWPKDPDKMKFGELAQVEVMDMTIVGGRIVHQA